jgi:thiol-disulfide isomerase/thioredoxin
MKVLKYASLIILLSIISGTSAGEWSVGASEDNIRQFYEDNREKVFTSSQTIWVKSIVTPDKESARQACLRGRAGEDFDELIAEYFVPYFASKPSDKYYEKRVEDFVSDGKRFWRGQSDTGPLAGMKAGDISDPVLRFGKGPDWAVLKIESVTQGRVAKFNDVRDSIYQLLWFKAADRTMLKEVDMGKNSWCGTCRAGHDVNSQLWQLAQKYDKAGQIGKAVSACLLALNEDRRKSRSKDVKINADGLYPEEQYLVDNGLDIVRYYAGSFNYLPSLSPPVSGANWRLGDIKDERAIPLLLKYANNMGKGAPMVGYVLATKKERKVIPALREMLKDRRVHITERHRGDIISFYAEYYIRERASVALKQIGEDTSATKITIGKVITKNRKITKTTPKVVPIQ